MFTIRPAASADAPPAIAALAQAFARDPLMLYLFAQHPRGIPAGIESFFSILLRARIAIAMPADVLTQDGAILGATMGYDTSRPTWTAPLLKNGIASKPVYPASPRVSRPTKISATRISPMSRIIISA